VFLENFITARNVKASGTVNKKYWKNPWAENKHGIRMTVLADNSPYDIDLVTDYDLTSVRQNFLGHTGVATVNTPDYQIKLGNKNIAKSRVLH